MENKEADIEKNASIVVMQEVLKYTDIIVVTLRSEVGESVFDIVI